MGPQIKTPVDARPPERGLHDYKTRDGFEDQNVLVLGIGNSATDIAVETSRVSKMTFLAMRAARM